LGTWGRRCRRPQRHRGLETGSSRHSRPLFFACVSVGHWLPQGNGEEVWMVKVEATVIRERIETVIDAVEEATGHVGVTVVEAIGHGRQRGITHEYRGRVFESRFLPKALLTFIVDDRRAPAVVSAVADAAQSGNEPGAGLVWTT